MRTDSGLPRLNESTNLSLLQKNILKIQKITCFKTMLIAVFIELWLSKDYTALSSTNKKYLNIDNQDSINIKKFNLTNMGYC